jgi:hypothetical protein
MDIIVIKIYINILKIAKELLAQTSKLSLKILKFQEKNLITRD